MASAGRCLGSWSRLMKRVMGGFGICPYHHYSIKNDKGFKITTRLKILLNTTIFNKVHVENSRKQWSQIWSYFCVINILFIVSAFLCWPRRCMMIMIIKFSVHYSPNQHLTMIAGRHSVIFNGCKWLYPLYSQMNTWYDTNSIQLCWTGSQEFSEECIIKASNYIFLTFCHCIWRRHLNIKCSTCKGKIWPFLPWCISLMSRYLHKICKKLFSLFSLLVFITFFGC